LLAIMVLRFHNGLRGGLAAALILTGLAAAGPALAQTTNAQTPKKPSAAAVAKPPAGKATDAKTPKPAGKEPDKSAAGGPHGKPITTFGEWTVFAAGTGKAKTCYALAKPTDRQPASLKRDPGYVFISNRPAESVTNEVAFVAGFDVKPGSTPTAEIGAANFDLIAQGGNLWVKNAAEEGKFVEALRKGQRLVVKASSKKGNQSTDIYILSGVSPALERARKECE